MIILAIPFGRSLCVIGIAETIRERCCLGRTFRVAGQMTICSRGCCGSIEGIDGYATGLGTPHEDSLSFILILGGHFNFGCNNSRAGIGR